MKLQHWVVFFFNPFLIIFFLFHSQNKSGNRQASIDQEDLKDDTDDFQEVDNQ